MHGKPLRNISPLPSPPHFSPVYPSVRQAFKNATLIISGPACLLCPGAYLRATFQKSRATNISRVVCPAHSWHPLPDHACHDAVSYAPIACTRLLQATLLQYTAAVPSRLLQPHQHNTLRANLTTPNQVKPIQSNPTTKQQTNQKPRHPQPTDPPTRQPTDLRISPDEIARCIGDVTVDHVVVVVVVVVVSTFAPLLVVERLRKAIALMARTNMQRKRLESYSEHRGHGRGDLN